MKANYLIIPIVLFILIVFFDQNRIPVPVKIIVGKPVHLELSIIIIVSIFIGMLLSLSGIFLFKRIRKRR